MADNRQIKYTADLDPAAFLRGSTAVNSALGSIQARMAGVASSMQEAHSSILGRWAGITAMIGSAAAAIGVFSFASMVKGAIDGAAALHDLSQVSGMTVESLSALSSVGKTSDTSIQQIVAASNKLSKAMASADEDTKGAGQALQALGLDVEKFQALAPEERMKAVAVAMEGFKDGAGKTAAAMALMGKEGAQMLPFLADLAQVGALQARVTTEQAAAADNFGDNLVKLKASGEGWKKELAMGMLPALNELSNVMLGVMNGSGGLRSEIKKLSADGTLAEWTRNGITGMTYLADAVQVVIRIFKAAGEVIGASMAMVATQVSGIGEAFAHLQNFEFSAARDSLKSVFTQSMTMANDLGDRVAEIFGEDTFGARIRAGMAAAKGQPASTPNVRSDLNFVDKSGKEKKEKKEADPSFMQYYEAALAQEKHLAVERDALRDYTKQQEAEFWRGILQNADVSGKDRVAITKKVADLEVQIMRDSAKQREALGMEYLKGTQQRALDAIEAARIEARGQYQLGEITNQQLLEQERNFEEQRTEVRRQFLQARMAMIDPDRDPVAYEQINQQIEELERQHQMKLRQIQIEIAGNAKDNPISRVWGAAQQSMETAIAGMINRTMTLRQAMASLWQGIRQSIVGEIAKIIAAQIAGWVKERALAMMKIGTNAVTAGSGAAASQSSIPYIGPVLAIAAMAAIMGAVMSSKGSVPSARAGFDIPAGINPLTQLHEREMVLPQDQADVVRDMAKGSQASAQPIQINLTGGDFIHKSQLASVLKQMDRDFVFTGVRR